MQTPNILTAFLTHIKLALTLSHDGRGMPQEVPGAFILAMAYIAVNVLNHGHAEGVDIGTLIMLGFIAQSYVIFLRNELIGLIMLISVLCNGFTLLISHLAGIPVEQLGLLVVAEYIFVTGAIVNVIKRATETIQEE